METTIEPPPPPTRQVRRPGQRRGRVIQLRISADDLSEIMEAAAREGLSRSAFVIRASLLRARGESAQFDPLLHALHCEFKDTAYRLNKIGVNLNQSVRKLNATGQGRLEIQAYAEVIFRTVGQLDAIAEQIWRRVR